MSENMQKVKLGDICDIFSGYAFKEFNSSYEGVPVLKIANILNNGHLNTTNTQYSNEKVNSRFISKRGDLLIAMSGATTGKVAIVDTDKPFYINQRVGIIRLKGGINIPIEYIRFLLNQNENTILKKAAGCAQPNISPNELKEITFYEKGVSLIFQETNGLLQVTNLIEKRNQQLTKLDELIKSKFTEMFGEYDLSLRSNNAVRLGLVAEIAGGSTPKTEEDKYWNGTYCWITPAEICADSYYIYDTERKLTDEGVKSCSLKPLPVGTVLLSSRAPIGKVAIAGVEMYCNQGFKNIICTEKLNPLYVYYLLKFNTDYLVSLGRGATFKEISKTIVENIYIPLPDIEHQNQFADFVEKVEGIKTKVKQSLAQLEVLKKSLMQKYFG